MTTVWITGLVVCLAWGFVEYCNDDLPEVFYIALQYRPVITYIVVVAYFVFWPATVALILEQAWKVKRERDKYD